NGLDPGSGPGLIFRTLPAAFVGMSGGAVFGALFFILLAFAAVTSIIAIIAPIVAYAEGKWGMTRRKGCIVFGTLAWAMGLVTVLSFNLWEDITPLSAIRPFAEMNFFALIDYFTANLMMPLGGILMAVFVGWLIKPRVLAEDLSFGSTTMFTIWLWMIRVIAPLAILGVLYSSL
ncbi:MAG: sodium-dependent transporter, partial [Gammaproteobacteria bacterium]|nr:sodium-dependent transporter [Gammaproteobacteria bacterium]